MTPELFASRWIPLVETGCHIWLGAWESDGYGVFVQDGVKVKAHRYALSLRLGVGLPPSLMALHHCDVRPCVNADHLYLGTTQDNGRDRAVRGTHTGRLIGQKEWPNVAAMVREGLSFEAIQDRYGISTGGLWGNLSRMRSAGLIDHMPVRALPVPVGEKRDRTAEAQRRGGRAQ